LYAPLPDDAPRRQRRRAARADDGLSDFNADFSNAGYEARQRYATILTELGIDSPGPHDEDTFLEYLEGQEQPDPPSKTNEEGTTEKANVEELLAKSSLGADLTAETEKTDEDRELDAKFAELMANATQKTALTEAIVDAHVRAFFYRDMVLHEIGSLLRTPGTCEAFMSSLETMAATGASPAGLLELIATHI
jgi:hypothetical protein